MKVRDVNTLRLLAKMLLNLGNSATGNYQLALHAKSQERFTNVLEEVINLQGGKNGGNYLANCWILGSSILTDGLNIVISLL